MPFYEYECAGCGEIWTALRAIDLRDDPAECPSCGAERSRRLISTFASSTAGNEPGCPQPSNSCGARPFG